MRRAIPGHSVTTFEKLCAIQYKLNINFNIYRKRMACKAGYWCVKICYLMQVYFKFNVDGNSGRHWLKKILLAALNSIFLMHPTTTQTEKFETELNLQKV